MTWRQHHKILQINHFITLSARDNIKSLKIYYTYSSTCISCFQQPYRCYYFRNKIDTEPPLSNISTIANNNNKYALGHNEKIYRLFETIQILILWFSCTNKQIVTGRYSLLWCIQIHTPECWILRLMVTILLSQNWRTLFLYELS